MSWASLGARRSWAPLPRSLLAIVFFATQSDKFLSGSNFSLILQQVMVVGTLAIGQTLVILTAGIDLSCSWIMALSTVMMTGLTMRSGMNPVLAIFVGILVCVVFGLLNGGLVTAIGLPPFIVTLGTFNIAYCPGPHLHHDDDQPAARRPAVPGETFKVGGTEVTYGSVVMLILYVIAWYVLRSTTVGRAVYAVGDNPEARAWPASTRTACCWASTRRPASPTASPGCSWCPAPAWATRTPGAETRIT